MRWHLFVIGKPKLDFAKLGVEEYAARLKPFASVEIECLKAGSREKESRALLDRSEGMFRVVLDERGAEIGSRALAQRISEWEMTAKRDVALLIGGADGLAASLRDRAKLKLAFGAATWPHQLVRIMLLEQLYRAGTILAGHPYHRG